MHHIIKLTTVTGPKLVNLAIVGTIEDAIDNQGKLIGSRLWLAGGRAMEVFETPFEIMEEVEEEQTFFASQIASRINNTKEN